MTLNNTEKINFMKNNFHQYFDLTLNTNISTTETVNLVIPISKLTEGETVTDNINEYHHDITYPDDYNINDILNKYEDTTYTNLTKCFCLRVIDGDTIDVKIPNGFDENENPTYEKRRIRLVGINTPEEGSNGYEVSKKFLEDICYSPEFKKKTSLSNSREIFLKIDSIKEHDSYGRTLAVLIYNNKNINEVLLKEKIAEVWYIPPSEFYPFDWANPDTSIHSYNFTNDDISTLYPYFNSEMTNIVFTPRDDITKIYRYEIYKGVIFLRLYPFSQNIRMHILPKGYDCSDKVLIFKDSMIDENNIKKSDDYIHYSDRNNINSYYQINNIIRDRTDPDISNEQYDINRWENTFCEFYYDISKSTKNFDNLQISAGYRYNESAPFYSIHYTGIRDNTNVAIEDRCTLIDSNYDKIEEKSNNIVQYKYDENKQLYLPKVDKLLRGSYEEDIDHVTNIQKTHHKNIKYINDSLYSEEDIEKNSNYNKRHTIADWVDISKED